VVADSGDQGHTRTARRLNEPRPVAVAAPEGVPLSVRGLGVSVQREEWRVSDRWWTEEPVRRRYFDLVLKTGENVVVFRDEERGVWFSQRGA
jgi:hypothetical protein